MDAKDIQYKIDRTGWASGPWNKEPDRVQWKTRAGLPGLIVRNRNGALCGYVGVASGHPAYQKEYDDVDADVHGGLTYSDACSPPICHVPEPGEPADVWWLGFDCAHADDISPGQDAYWKELDGQLPPGSYNRSYRTIAYVRREVEDLATQLAAQVKP